MSQELVPVLAGVLNMKPEDLTEKIKTPEGVTEISNSVKELKVFPNATAYNESINAYLKNIKPTLKDEFYREQKKDIHEAMEKSIKGSDPEVQALTFGKDYNSTEELIQKKVEILTKKAGAGGIKKEEWETEREKMQGTIRELTTKAKEAETAAEKAFREKLNKKTLGYAIKSFESRINAEKEKVPGQLNYLEFLFNQSGAQIDYDENGKEILRDAKGEIIKNQDYTTVTLDAYLEDIANKNLPLHKVIPAGGRGDNPGETGANGGLDMSMYQTWDAFMQTERGKSLVPGSKQANEAYANWKKAHPNK